MIEIVAPPPEDWPERITLNYGGGMVLMERDSLVVGSLTAADWRRTLTAMIAALAILGYAVESDNGTKMTFTRHSPEGWEKCQPTMTP